MEGREYVCGDLSGGKGSSCKVNTQTGKWSDFAIPEQRGGDPISLYAAVRGLSQSEAALELAKQFGLPNGNVVRLPQHSRHSKSVATAAPPDAHAPSCNHSKHGKPSQVWRYLDAAGHALFYVARYDNGDGKKVFVPWTWNGSKWIPEAWRPPRPLYRLDCLQKYPNALVIVCEGEKAAERAASEADDSTESDNGEAEDKAAGEDDKET